MNPWQGRMSLTLALLVPLLFAGCGGGGGGGGGTSAPAATIQSIAVTPASLTIPVGVARQFVATGTYSDGTSKDITSSAVWTSGTASVATVSGSGLAVSVSPGATLITATLGGVKGTATLTVSAATLQTITVMPANPSIAGGLTIPFNAKGAYSDGTTQDITGTVAWTSGTTSVATISASGVATSVAPGTTVISATQGTINGTTTLTVTAATLQTITVKPANPTITKGLTEQFTALGIYSDGTSKDITSSVTWASGTTSVATISASGLATGVAAGTSTITAALGNVNGVTTLTVALATLQAIAVTPVNPALAIGASQQMTATGTYSDGSTANVTTSVTWTSGATAVATISSGGLLTGVASGTAAITAASGTVSGSTTATVASAGTASTLAIYPGQVVSGVVDQNGGAYSAVFPYLLVATGGNVGPAGYTWTAAPGYVLPFPSLSIAINGVVSDSSPKSLTTGSYLFYVEVSDGTSTNTAAVTLDLTSGCNSSNGNSGSTPCYSTSVTNVHVPYLPNGKVGSPYAATIVTSGGTAPYRWALESGALPPGITIDPAHGLLTGTPTTAGPYSFYVLTTDSSGGTTAPEMGVLAAQFTIVVN